MRWTLSVSLISFLVFKYKSTRKSFNPRSLEWRGKLTLLSRFFGFKLLLLDRWTKVLAWRHQYKSRKNISLYYARPRVMFDVPSVNEPWVASQRTQQCTVTMKQWTMAPHLVYRASPQATPVQTSCFFIPLEILPTKDSSRQKAREAYLTHKGKCCRHSD